MAVKLSKVKTIEVIARIDEAIGLDESDTAEVYNAYLESLDEGLLNLKPGIEPTRFVLRVDLPYDDYKRIQSEMIQMKTDPTKVRQNHMDVSVDVIGPRYETIRAALIDIKNPDSVPEADRVMFKKDTDGLAAKELVVLLARAGVLEDLATAHQKAGRMDGNQQAKKN